MAADQPRGFVSRREVEWDTLLVTRREVFGRRVLDFRWFDGSCTYNGPALLRQFIERLNEELAWMEGADVVNAISCEDEATAKADVGPD